MDDDGNDDSVEPVTENLAETTSFYSKRLRKYRKMALQAVNHALKRFSHSHLFDESILKSGLAQSILPIIKNFHISSIGKSAAIIDVIHTVMTFRGLTEKYFNLDMMRLLVDIITEQKLAVKEFTDQKSSDRSNANFIFNNSSSSPLKSAAIKCILDYCSGIDNTPKGSLDMDTHNPVDHKNSSNIQQFKEKLVPYFKCSLKDSKLPENELEILQLLQGSVVDLEIARMLLLQVKNSRKDQFFIKGEDVLLKTISGLIDNTETSVAEFFGEFVKLLSKIRSQSGKTELIACFESLFRGSESSDLVNIVKDLNSYSKKYVNEVDFERRLIAFKSLSDNFETLSPKIVEILIAQCTIELKQTDDLSLRSAVTGLMTKLVVSEKINTDLLITNARDIMKGTVLPGYSAFTNLCQAP